MAKINLDYKQGETDKEYYIRLAKAVDQRLVRIEDLSGLRGAPPVPGYEYAYKYGYRKALEALPDNQIRFNATIPQPGTFEWRERVNAMRNFLSAPSSTKTGIKKTFINKAKTINEKYGTNFSGEQLAEFFSKGDWDKLYRDYGSDTIFVAIGKIKQIDDKLKKGLENIKDISSGPEDEAALQILRQRNLKLYKSYSKDERALIRKAIRNL